MNFPPQLTTGKAPNTSRSGWRAAGRAASGSFSNTTRKNPEASKAFVDWLGVSFQLPQSIDYPADKTEQVSDALKETLLDFLSNVYGIHTTQATGGGWSGYLHRWKLGNDGALGWISFGGANQNHTVNVQLTGTGCAAVKDWASLIWWGRGMEHHCGIKPESIRITRLDLAHDDIAGRRVNIEQARNWYESGEFTNGGRAPTSRLIDDMGSREGKTFYVGKRENGKLCRVYEKGRELGDKSSEWVRVEVEWRSKDRFIPWEALERPAEYLAAAYPCLSWIETVKAVIRTCKKAAEITYARMIGWLQHQAGSAIWAAVHMNGGDISEVFDKVARQKWPPRLLQYQQRGLNLQEILT